MVSEYIYISVIFNLLSFAGFTGGIIVGVCGKTGVQMTTAEQYLLTFNILLRFGKPDYDV